MRKFCFKRIITFILSNIENSHNVDNRFSDRNYLFINPRDFQSDNFSMYYGYLSIYYNMKKNSFKVEKKKEKE